MALGQGFFGGESVIISVLVELFVMVIRIIRLGPIAFSMGMSFLKEFIRLCRMLSTHRL